MSTNQHRNMQATPADVETLESLSHMTSWARQSAASGEGTPAQSRFGSLVDCFALGATAFHPGPWVYPIDTIDETDVAREDRPRNRSIGFRAVRAAGRAMVRLWCYFQERRATSRATALLSEMDDRSLSDIGITRADIGRAARYGRDWERWH